MTTDITGLQNALIAKDIQYSFHNNDLYILDNKENNDPLKEFGYYKTDKNGKSFLSACAEKFKCQITGKHLISLYFMYTKEKKIGAFMDDGIETGTEYSIGGNE